MSVYAEVTSWVAPTSAAVFAFLILLPVLPACPPGRADPVPHLSICCADGEQGYCKTDEQCPYHQGVQVFYVEGASLPFISSYLYLYLASYKYRFMFPPTCNQNLQPLPFERTHFWSPTSSSLFLPCGSGCPDSSSYTVCQEGEDSDCNGVEGFDINDHP